MDPLRFCSMAVADASAFASANSKDAPPQAQSVVVQDPVGWQPPSLGVLKFNVDGAVCRNLGQGGVGIIVRDSAGRFIAARARAIDQGADVVVVEAMAVREALFLGAELGARDILVESDSEIVVVSLQNGGVACGADVVIADVLSLRPKFGTCEFRFVRRGANCVAHALALRGAGGAGCSTWELEAPCWLSGLLQGITGDDQKPGTSMADICDDLVVEIISYLPLKSAVRCKLLDKYFNALISNHYAAKHARQSAARHTTIFHCSNTSPKIFYNIPVNPPPNAVNLPVNLPLIVPILASCNGLLLLKFPDANVCCVCNPLTMAYQLISYPPNSYLNGLAVDTDTAFSYKLVAIKREMIRQNIQMQYEFTIFEPDANSWRKSKISVYESSKFVNCQAIYLNRCLHWLRQCGDIVVFDTEKEHSRIIEKPPGFECGVIMWFGVAECRISLVSALNTEIVIRTLHEENWRVRARIDITAGPWNDYRNAVPVLFNGDRLFLQIRAGGTDGEIFMYDLKTKFWGKIGMVPAIMDAVQVFVNFFPTIAKVSTVNHVPGKEETISTSLHKIEECIRGLNELLA